MPQLLFGGTGIPRPPKGQTKKYDSVTALRAVKELGLEAMELAFVHSVFLKPMTASKVKAEAQKCGIALTVHAPYYINLNPKTPAGEAYSTRTLYEAAKIGDLAGATDIAFHPGSYLKGDPKEVFNIVKKNLLAVADNLAHHHIRARLRPEIGGKLAAFGTLEEIVALSKLRDNIGPCLDFAHLVARTNGASNNYKSFVEVFDYVKSELGTKGLENLHIQFAGIAYTDKGEKNHLNFDECDFDYKALAKALADCKVGGIAICESPEKEHDALLLKKEYERAMRLQ